MIPNTISFLCTYNCNFFCKHCSVSASTDRNLALPIEYLRKTLDYAYSIPSIQVIVFTGGEPTLYPHLKFGVKYASDMGFTVRMVTNAWWAESYKRAKEFLDELHSLGLKELNISYDDFHFEYLKKFGGEQNVINAVRASLDLGLTVLIAITKLPDSKITVKYLKNLLPAEFGNRAKNVLFIEDFIAPVGRAKKLKDELRTDSDHLNFGCKDIGTIAICPDGRITACCGHIFSSNALEMLTIGNIKNNDLTVAIKRMQRNVLYWWIALRGPQEILKILKINKKVYHKCEACELLYNNKEKLKTIASKKKEIFETLKRGDMPELRNRI